FAFFSTSVGLGFIAMSLIGACLAAIWTGSGLYLGKVFNRRTEREEQQGASSVAHSEPAT
ncbi:MAG TPA: hypothetical protein VIV64_05830, partial [Gammaproteobacteria bacterium]